MDTRGPEMAADAAADRRRAVLDKVATALTDLRFGEVRLVVHDGDVVHIERTEKVRLQPQRSP